MGWIANLALMVGVLLLAYNKKRFGFLAGVIGNFLWFIKGIEYGKFDLVFVAFFMTLFNGWGWYRACKDDEYWQALLLLEHKRKWWQIWR